MLKVEVECNPATTQDHKEEGEKSPRTDSRLCPHSLTHSPLTPSLTHPPIPMRFQRAPRNKAQAQAQFRSSAPAILRSSAAPLGRLFDANANRAGQPCLFLGSGSGFEFMYDQMRWDEVRRDAMHGNRDLMRGKVYTVSRYENKCGQDMWKSSIGL
jgi:hypothetical protein